MDISQSPLVLGFSIGRYFGVTVRVSVWLIALVFVLSIRLGLTIGLWASALLFISILIHEYAHIFGARATGGQGDEILMWPLGGLAFVSPAPGFRPEFWTIAAGPLSNLVLCLISLPAVISAGVFWDSLHPVMLPPLDFSISNVSTLINSVFVLLFALNLKLFLLNLLPVHPLDGGRIAYAIAKLNWERTTAKVGSLFLGAIVCMILTFAGLIMKSTEIVFFGFLLLSFGLQEHMQAITQRQLREMGFSSLDDEDEYGLFQEEYEPQPGMLERWKQRREEKRREKAAQQQIETAQRVDALLEKINTEGMEALSEAEKKFLQQASSKYKTQRD